jgi:hypothetical protein
MPQSTGGKATMLEEFTPLLTTQSYSQFYLNTAKIYGKNSESKTYSGVNGDSLGKFLISISVSMAACLQAF